jgi:hypothetical protein
MTEITGKTSQDVGETGTYGTNCCDVEILFEEGATFWRCPKCQALALWKLVTVDNTEAAA